MNPQMLQVLSEPNRLDIVELLRTGAKSVNEITQKLSLNQPQVSKHLRVLADAGIVEVHPLAQQRYYQLSPKPFRELEIWLDRYKSIWEQRLSRLDMLIKKEVKNHGRK